MRFRRGALLIAALASSVAIARAADDEIKLGPVTGYSTEAQAAGSCPEGVVWIDRKTGFYYPKFSPDYGKTPNGTFACYKEAKKADYWGMGTADSMMNDRGRVFTWTHDEICTWFQDKAGKWKCGSVGS